jgi:hypothetical protein
MSDDIINQTSQFRRLAAGEFYGLWRGQGIYLTGGRMRLSTPGSSLSIPSSLRFSWRHSPGDGLSESSLTCPTS